jgi:hypothetical protein
MKMKKYSSKFQKGGSKTLEKLQRPKKKESWIKAFIKKFIEEPQEKLFINQGIV